MISTSFPLSSRIHTSEGYAVVFENEKRRRFHSKRFTSLSIHNNTASARLGIVVAKKHVKSAVKRNLIKRIVRESFREFQSKLPSIDVVVMAKSTCLGERSERQTTALIKQELQRDIKKQWAFLIGQ